MGRQATAISSIRLHRPYHFVRHHGSRGSKTEARCGQDYRIFLLETPGKGWIQIALLVEAVGGIAEVAARKSVRHSGWQRRPD